MSDHPRHRPVTQKRASTLEVLPYRQRKDYMLLLSMQPLEEWKLVFLRTNKPARTWEVIHLHLHSLQYQLVRLGSYVAVYDIMPLNVN